MGVPLSAQPRSVRRSILTFLLISVFLTGAFLASLLYLDQRENRACAAFVSRSVRVGDVSAVLGVMERRLDGYMRAWSRERQDSYLEASRELDAALADIRVACRNRQQSLNYIRRIGAFNEYQRDILFQPGMSPAERHRTLAYVRTALASHTIHAQELAAADLVLSRGLYRWQLARLKGWHFGLWVTFVVLYLLTGGAFIRELRRIGVYMREMHRNLRALSGKDWSAPDLDDGRYAEFSGIAGAINEMKHVISGRIERLEEHARLEHQLDLERLENERKEHMLVEAQMSVLKSQINPHFLFNTLNIIGKAAFLREPEKAMELIEATAIILRYSMNTVDRHVTIRDELNIVETYLYLQKARFGPALTYGVRIDAGLEEVPVQSMLVQPVIENCFKHGFDSRTALHIDIRVRDAGDRVEIDIRDNGGGFDARVLGDGGKSGTGLRNLRRRLELEYGSAGVLLVESAPGTHTLISITVPKQRMRAK